jgi:hypothetical protein
MALIDNMLYVPGWDEGLDIVDVSNLSEPVLCRTLFKGEMPGLVCVSGNRAYLSLFGKGLVVLDVSNPSDPVEEELIAIEPLTMKISNRRAYLYGSGMVGEAGLSLIDLSEKLTPLSLGFGDDYPIVLDLAVSGTKVWVPCYTGGMRVIETADPLKPVLLGRYRTVAMPRNIAKSGKVLYVDGPDRIDIVDISRPEEPWFIGSIDSPSGIEEMAAEGSSLVTVDQESNLTVFDISDPFKPLRGGVVKFQGEYPRLTYGGDLAFIAADGEGVQIFDIRDKSMPIKRGEFLDENWPTAIAVSGINVFLGSLSDNGSSLEIIDISDPSKPMHRASLGLPGHVRDVAFSDNLIGALDRGYEESRLLLIDVSRTDAPVLRGSCKFPASGYHLSMTGSLAYITCGFYGLRVFDISNPDSPIHLGTVEGDGEANNVVSAGNVAFVTFADGDLEVFKVHGSE